MKFDYLYKFIIFCLIVFIFIISLFKCKENMTNPSFVASSSSLYTVPNKGNYGIMPGVPALQNSLCTVIDNNGNPQVFKKGTMGDSTPIKDPTKKVLCGKNRIIQLPKNAKLFNNKPIPNPAICSMTPSSNTNSFKGLCDSGDHKNYYKISK